MCLWSICKYNTKCWNKLLFVDTDGIKIDKKNDCVFNNASILKKVSSVVVFEGFSSL